MLDIIFLMFLVAFIITRLYSVFGSHGTEKNMRIIIKPLDKDVEKTIMEAMADENIENDISVENPEIEDVENLSEQDKILATIPSFNKESFL